MTQPSDTGHSKNMANLEMWTKLHFNLSANLLRYRKSG
mgnify:FL=1